MKMMRKDLRLALEMGAQFSIPLPVTSLGEHLHTTGIDLGFENSDFGRVVPSRRAILLRLSAVLSHLSHKIFKLSSGPFDSCDYCSGF